MQNEYNHLGEFDKDHTVTGMMRAKALKERRAHPYMPAKVRRTSTIGGWGDVKSKCKEGICKEDRCLNQRQNGSSRCKSHARPKN